jgi:uncharacterized protein with PIN domain
MVLDSAALVTFLCGEPGATEVAAVLEHPTVMSAYSALELAAALPHVPARELGANLKRLGVQLLPLEVALALELGALDARVREGFVTKALAKSQGVSVFAISNKA